MTVVTRDGATEVPALRVQVVDTIGAGDAFAFISLYDSRRIELRLMQGGASSLYAIYALNQTD